MNTENFMKDINSDTEKVKQLTFTDLFKLFLLTSIKVSFGLFIYWFIKQF